MDIARKVAELKGVTPRLHPPKKYSERRPWGGFDRFVYNESCTVKILTILPGESLSLQSHQHHSEWWIVLDASLGVEIDGKKHTAFRGEEVFIPVGTKHRAHGLKAPCRWLEISFGVDDEEDIERFEDNYGRATKN